MNKKTLLILSKMIKYGSFFPVIKNYSNLIKQSVRKYFKDSLITNLIVNIAIDKNDIKSSADSVLTLFLINNDISCNDFKVIDINNPKHRHIKIDIDKEDSGYGSYYKTNDQENIIAVFGENEYDIDWYFETIEHELIHLFELDYGYSNKNIKQQPEYYYENDYNWHLSNEKFGFLNKKFEKYFTDAKEYTAYFYDLINFSKKFIRQNNLTIKKYFNLLLELDFNNINSFYKFYRKNKNNINGIESIAFIYHLYQKDKQLFNKTMVKLFNNLYKK